MHSVYVTYDRLLWHGLKVFIYFAWSSSKVHSFVNQSYNWITRLEDTSQTQKCDIQTDWQMNRQIYNTHMYLFNNCGGEQKKSVQSFHYHFCSFITIYIHVSYQSSKKGCACNAAFNMLHARLCTCRADYIDMNKPEQACLSYWLTGKGDKTLNVQYILHLNNILSR